MVRRVLIANRGEIAVRVVRACREEGVEAVVATAPGDETSLAASVADDVAAVPSYLDAEALVAAALAAGADAVHPGYGFLSEDPAFADAVLAAGLRWIGPPPAAMRALGDKVEARELAEEAGVPGAPGAAGDDAALLAAAPGLGLPLLVKAVAGGGGRGMRAVEDLARLPDLLKAARDEATAAFGDGRVFLERRLSGVRHVEVQVVLDDHGGAIHLGERDCSLQRRHQKIVEESPSPAVDDTLRARLGEAAVAIARAAGYRSAGTVEFLLLPDGSFAFLEMNARLQVEHPVTEAVTGIDLVRAQLAIASGEPLDITQTDVAFRGHAVEARVYAEDPADGFLPTGGRVARLRFPRWPGVRVDTALRQGDVVGLGYDPLLGKVIATGPARPAALARLRAALAETLILGLPTNLGFLLETLAHPDVVAGTAGTDWVTDVWRPDPPPLPEGVRADPVDPHDPWTVFGDAPPPPREVGVADGWAQFRGWAYRLAADELAPVELPPPGGSLTAPMPASVRSVDVAPGDTVTAGQTVVVLEAMKMQLAVQAPAHGEVRAVHVRAGDVVAKGQALVEVDG
jgi:acetyl-CoA/propionyl-CoA carboxylase biotin carboxyl carrier protein